MEFTGERMIPGQCALALEMIHTDRYRLVLADTGLDGLAVLDAPCGTGYGTEILSAAVGGPAYGVDIDEEAIEYAKNHFGYTCGPSFVAFPIFDQSDIADLGGPIVAASGELPDGEPFDVVVCFEGIEHVSEDAGRAWLDAFANVTRKGGFLYMSTPNPVASKSGGGKYHKHEYTPAELKRAVNDTGKWKVVRAWKQSRDPELSIRQADNLSELLYWNTDDSVGFAILKAVRI